LIRQLRSDFTFEAEAPGSVEITVFHQKEAGRYLLSLVNFQKDMPNIPVNDIRVKISLNGRKPGRLLSLPDEKSVGYETNNGSVEVKLARLETFQMLALEYR
jgi:hypothetical protein